MSALIGNPMLLTSAPSGDGDAYQIEKSLRFNSADSAYLSRTFGLGNRRTFTWAGWVKRNKLGATQSLFNCHPSSNDKAYFHLHSEDKLGHNSYHSSTWWNGGTERSPELLRDPSAWMHVVFVMDTTNSEPDDRYRYYVNGKRLTHPGGDYGLNILNTLNTAVQHNIGGNYNDSNYGDFYLADVQFIDGLALSPAAFGEFDSNTGVWNPKAFALPAPNDGTTWSDNLTASGGTFDATRAFDGDDATASDLDDNQTAAFKPSKEIVASASIEVLVNNIGDGSFKQNGQEVGAEINNTNGNNTKAWFLLPQLTINTTDGIEWMRGSSWAECSYVYAFRVDGVELIDGQTDPTTRDNPNDGQTWSDYLTHTAGGTGTTDGFDGRLVGGSYASSSSNPATWTLPSALAYDKLEIKAAVAGSGWAFTINGTDVTSNFSVGNKLQDATDWVSGNTISSMTWSKPSGSDYISVETIKVNGHILVDSTVDNSFHLKFDDTSSKSALGYNSFSEDLTETTDKSKPILKTNSVGTELTSGYHTDSDASNLLFAVPGNSASGVADVHDEITGTSGSEITTTNVGSIAHSTSNYKYYGSSLAMGDGKHILTGSIPRGSGDVTVEAWLKIDSFVGTSGTIQTPLAEWSGAVGNFNINRNNWGDGTDKDYTFSVYNGSSSIWSPKDTFVLGEWFHACMTYDHSATTVRLYCNGKKVLENTSFSMTMGSSTCSILGETNTGGNYMNGEMQDFRVYSCVKYPSAGFDPVLRKDFTVNNILAASSGPVWSTHLTSTNGWYSGFENTNGFDGSPTTGNYVEGGSNATITFAPPGGIAYSSKVEVMSKNGSSAAFNGGSTVSMSNNTWVEMATGSGTLNTIVMTRSDSTGGQLQGIRVDGDILIDSTGGPEEVDALTDSPTNYGTDTGAGGEVQGNYATWNPLQQSQGSSNGTVTTQGNLHAKCTYQGVSGVASTLGANTGKWYAEFEITGSENWGGVGIVSAEQAASNTDNSYGFAKGNMGWIKHNNGNVYTNSGNYTAHAAFTYGDVIGVAMDLDAGKIWWAKNGVWDSDTSSNVGNPGTGANPTKTYTADTSKVFLFAYHAWGSASGTLGATANFGQRAFKYTAPSGFKALCTQNLDDLFSGDELNNPSKYFDVRTWEGNSTAGTDIGEFKFGPDFVWIKQRDGTNWHKAFDIIRGVGKPLHQNETNAEGSEATTLTAFNSDGFELGNNGTVNWSDYSYLGYGWDAGTEETAYAKYLTGGVDSSFPAINGFDGSTSTFTRTTTNGAMTFEPASDIAFTKLEIYANNDNSGNGFTNTWKVNGTDVTSTVNSAAQTSFAWVDVTSSVSSPLDKLEVISGPSGGSNPRFGAIRVNDVILTANGDGVNGLTAERWTNTTAGFSIIKYDGGGNSVSTVGHGLNAPPELIIIKNKTAADDWAVYHEGLGNTKDLCLNSADAASTRTMWNDTSPTNTVFTLGAAPGNDFHNRVNQSGQTYIAYCWTPIPGYSDFGKYTGNGNDAGPFIHTGFAVKWLMIRQISGNSWSIIDIARDSVNPTTGQLYADSSAAEATGTASRDRDLLSNGFRPVGTSGEQNANNETYVYAAFAEHPQKLSRAR